MGAEREREEMDRCGKGESHTCRINGGIEGQDDGQKLEGGNGNECTQYSIYNIILMLFVFIFRFGVVSLAIIFVTMYENNLKMDTK